MQTTGPVWLHNSGHQKEKEQEWAIQFNQSGRAKREQAEGIRADGRGAVLYKRRGGHITLAPLASPKIRCLTVHKITGRKELS